MAKVDPTVANNIKRVLRAREAPETALARRVGMTQVTLNRRLRALSPFTIEEILDICEALDVPLDEVIGERSRGIPKLGLRPRAERLPRLDSNQQPAD